jgi:glycosyltransferase involved in cell wall biosynthesis
MHFLYVGRLSSEKRVGDLIQAFGSLTGQKYEDWSLHVVGEGPLRDQLELMAHDDARVVFTGSLDYVALGTEYRLSDALVLPSSREPWGLVINEAIGHGLFTITTDQVGAAHDLVDERTGITYPVGDLERLARALVQASKHLVRSPRVPSTDTAQLMDRSIRQLNEA